MEEHLRTKITLSEVNEPGIHAVFRKALVALANGAIRSRLVPPLFCHPPESVQIKGDSSLEKPLLR